MITMGDDKKKYIAMEPILNSINRDFISLSDAETKRNNEVLKSVITKITDLMKEEDIMFKTMYTRVFYGGSYYDGLRVGHPEEYDLDLLLSVPKFAAPDITTSNKPGFVHLQFKEFARFSKQPEASVKYRQLKSLLDDADYFLTNSVRQWMEGVVTKALNKCPKDGSFYQLTTPMATFKLGVTKGGPAITLKLEGTVKGERVKMDIDLVPCFVFSGDKWPANGFKRNPVSKKPDYFIVPKSPKCGGGPRYWRLSFQEQERELMDGKKTLKPTIKLLKLLRDKENHVCIASYYIKTILLSLVESNPDEFWKDPLSSVFMKALKEYQQHIDNKQIMYFWNKKNNLLDNLKPELLMNISNRLKVIISDIDNHLDNPKIVTKYLSRSQLDLSMDLCSSEILCGIAVDEVLETNVDYMVENGSEHMEGEKADYMVEIPSEQLEEEKAEEPQCSYEYSRQAENSTKTDTSNLLLQRKVELVELQINLLKIEHERREKRNQEKHELEMKYLESKISCSCENKMKN